MSAPASQEFNIESEEFNIESLIFEPVLTGTITNFSDILAPKPKTLRNVEFDGNVNSEVVSMEPVSTEGEEEAASTSKQIASRFRFFCSVCNRGFALKHHVVRHEEKIHNIVRPKMRQQASIHTTLPCIVKRC